MRGRPTRSRRTRSLERRRRARRALPSRRPGLRRQAPRRSRAGLRPPSRGRRWNGLVPLEQAERIAFGVLAAREPADPGDRLLVVRLSAVLAHLREIAVDVVAAVVDDRPALAQLPVHGAARIALLEPPIVDPGHPRALDRPAADSLPEPLGTIRILCRELDVNHFLAHRDLLFRRSYTLTPLRAKGRRWFARSSCTTRSRTRLATKATSRCAGGCRVRHFGTGACSVHRSASRPIATTPSSNGRTRTGSKPRHAATSSWRPPRTPPTWAAASRCCSQTLTEPTHPYPRSPDELGFETIVYDKTPPRATIRLNRPDVLNAFDFQMLREIPRPCEDAGWDDDTHVVVVTGTGRAFCVGADLKSWSADYLGKPREYWKWFGAFKDMHDRLREVGKPTLARINGMAVGGGNELQMACD